MAKTLLLADDSVTIQKVVGISFASEDVTLITVDNGDDAISRAREIRPDAILADVVMPGKNGYEVCEAIKDDPDLRHIPVLLLTGTFEAYDEERAERVGASGHVSKPFEAQTLVDEVKHMFAQSAGSAGPATPTAAPAAVAVAAAEDADDTASDSFDFFDEDLGETADAGGGERTELIESDELDLATAADALSLDDTRPPISGGAGEPVAERTMVLPGAGGPHETYDAAQHTIAIPPEESPPPAPREPVNLDEADLPPMAERGLSGAAADFLAPDTAVAPAQAPAAAAGADAITQPSPPVASDPGASLGSSLGDSLDPLLPVADGLDFDFETPSPALGDDSAVRVDSADLAEATVLDPAGASGFDVSSSDLGNAMPPLPSEPPSPAPAAAPADDPWPAKLPTWVEPATTPQPAPRVAPAPAGEPEAALSAIAPALREQLHDTLEKIAWESFSDVSEKIVRQAVEKLETIAWEVIPQLAETLVREEIRRMKRESGDE